MAEKEQVEVLIKRKGGEQTTLCEEDIRPSFDGEDIRSVGEIVGHVWDQVPLEGEGDEEVIEVIIRKHRTRAKITNPALEHVAKDGTIVEGSDLKDRIGTIVDEDGGICYLSTGTIVIRIEGLPEDICFREEEITRL